MDDKDTENSCPPARKGKREAPISYRPPETLKAEFHRRVEKSGMSISAFITKLVFDQNAPRQSRRPPLESKQLARLLIDVGKIREQLSELSDSSDNDAIESVIAELSEIRTAILRRMGRSP